MANLHTVLRHAATQQDQGLETGSTNRQSWRRFDDSAPPRCALLLTLGYC